MSASKRLGPVVLIAASALVGRSPAHEARLSQERPRTVFRAESRIVYVDVLVEHDGVPYTGLTGDDFVVFDDGESRPIALAVQEEAPLDLTVALDTSSSTAGATLGHLRHATKGLIELLESDDAVALIGFSHHVSLKQASTTDHARVVHALDALTGYGETAWRDALFAALLAETAFDRRRLVMLFTDGDDTYSWLSDEDVLAVADGSNVLVYAVTARTAESPLGSADESQRRRVRVDISRRARSLRRIAEATGGRLLEIETAENLPATFVEILRESRSRYLLGFVPAEPNRPGWHELKVEIVSAKRRLGLDVRARRGYYVDANDAR